jgi:hypothetical protein
MTSWNKGTKGICKPNSGSFKKGNNIGFKKGNLYGKRIKTEEEKKIIGDSHRGEKSVDWKGESASYGVKHRWIRKNYSNPLKCETCGEIGKKIGRRWNIDWSNKDHKYRRVREDYVGRCQKCHTKYDERFKKIIK